MFYKTIFMVVLLSVSFFSNAVETLDVLVVYEKNTISGYTDLMKEFINSNPGLKSRFNQYINFKDYKSNELRDIFYSLCQKEHLKLSDNCTDFIENYFIDMYNNRSINYANGRDVRNFFEKVIKARANRIAQILSDISYEDFLTITLSDLEAAKKANVKL